MKNSMLRAVIVFVLLLAAGCAGGGGQQNTLATPEETVKAYCELDAQGVRLTSTTWYRVLPYISWSEEAGFDRAVVISGFTVGKVEKKSEKEATVTVDYQVLGTVSGEYAAGRKTESVRFRVAKTGRGWKITEPDFLPPHVAAKAMVKHLEGTKKSETAEKIRSEVK